MQQRSVGVPAEDVALAQALPLAGHLIQGFLDQVLSFAPVAAQMVGLPLQPVTYALA